MAKSNKDTLRSKTITIGEVADILNEYEVPINYRAQLAMIRRARPKLTFKYVMNRAWAYAKAFFPALIFTIKQKLNVEGKYSKGGIVDGRKDL